MVNRSRRSRGGNGAQFLQYFAPVLKALRDLGGSGTPSEVIEKVAHDLPVPENVQNETTPSGELRFPNAVHWARFYLSREGYIDSSRRGVWNLTQAGREATLSPQDCREIFLKWVQIDSERRKSKEASFTADDRPEVEVASLKADYRSDAIEKLLELPPGGFERLSQRLLREAGFTEVVVTGKSNDGGIDGYGTLKINALVSFKVLFQCKRYKGTVVPSVVRDFRGAMAGRADKGIIITTGGFTAEAKREATRDGAPPIELIDGEKLVDMMEDLELGLRPVKTYEVDQAFFAEFVTS